MSLTRRDALLSALFGSSYLGLRALATGLPVILSTGAARLEEIAQTFDAIGLTPQILAGAADLYRFVHSTPLGQLTPEDPKPDFQAMIATLAQELAGRAANR